MYLAYVDESGDRGPRGSKTYTLGCVLIRASRWQATFDGLIGFRRFLKREFDLPIRAEIKANHILQNAECFRDLALSERARRFVYTGLLRTQATLGLSTFAIVINKSRLHPNVDPLDRAWTYLLQRLQRLSDDEDTQVLVVHDEGESSTIRGIARRARRVGSAGSIFGTGRIDAPFTRLIDDPVPRDSKQSYLLQLADLNAYAAFRCCIPPPERRVQIVPTTMWNELGTARFAAANRRAGGPSSGIVFWPR